MLENDDLSMQFAMFLESQELLNYSKRVPEEREREKKQIVVGPRRTSTCMKCSRRNRWRIHHPDEVPHGNAINYRAAVFIKFDKYTPRSELVKNAQLENHDGSMKFETY